MAAHAGRPRMSGSASLPTLKEREPSMDEMRKAVMLMEKVITNCINPFINLLNQQAFCQSSAANIARRPKGKWRGWFNMYVITSGVH